MFSKLASKRPMIIVNFEDSKSDPKKKKENSVALLSKVNITKDFEKCSMNSVWMNPNDIKALYPGSDQNENRLVKIFDRIYPLLSDSSVKKGNILINFLQKEEIYEGIVKQEKLDYIQVSNVIENQDEFDKLSSVNFEFCNISKNSCNLAFNLDQLKSKFHELFDDNIFNDKQQLYFEVNNFRYKMVVHFPDIELKGTTFKCITNKSKINFYAKSSVLIYNQVIKIASKSKDECLNNNIKFTIESFKPMKEIANTKIINVQKFALTVNDNLKDKIFFQNSAFKINYKSFEYDIRIKDIPDQIDMDYDDKDLFAYSSAYTLDKGYINFIFDIEASIANKIMFYHGKQEAELFELEITKNKNFDDFFNDEDGCTWVSAEEIVEKVKNKYKSFLEKEVITEKLSRGTFDLKVKEIEPWIYREEERFPSLRTISEKAIFNFSTHDKNVIIVDNSKSYNVSKVVLEIKPQQRRAFSIFINSENNKEIVLSTTQKKVSQLCQRKLHKMVLNKQSFFIECNDKENKSISLPVTVESIEYEDLKETPDYSFIGKITPNTVLEIKIPSDSKITFGIDEKNLMNDTELAMQELEKVIGGASEQLKTILRSVVLSRGPLKEEWKKRGLKSLKGMLLYGPPGTGKTTLARNIGKFFGCTEGKKFQLLNASELTNKYVGETESKIRELFEPAEMALKQEGGEDDLHIIVIDECESLFGTRRSNSDSPWYNSWINQFLGKIDGLKELKNIFVILLTNRKDIIDPAVLRPGRIELHLEMGLPNFSGRKDIFNIHLKTLKENNLLGSIDIDQLATKTEKCSGAEIEGIVKDASTYSLERLSKLTDKKDISDHKSGKVTMKDFEKAIETCFNRLREKGSDILENMTI